MTEHRKIEILLVEDDPTHCEITKIVLDKSNIQNNLHIVYDGDEAMKFLMKEGDYEGSVTPDLVLLDLRLPTKDGLEVLEEMKSDPVLQRIPVVVLTSSESEDDAIRSYKNFTEYYINKPFNNIKLITLIEKIESLKRHTWQRMQ